MISQKYSPQPGTIPHRVVEYLRGRPSGAWSTSAEIADALGVEHGFEQYMSLAVQTGVILKARRGGFRCWSLGDGTSPAFQMLRLTPGSAV